MATGKELSSHADIIAERFKGKGMPDKEIIRDICDHQTYGELDDFQLDLLSDMVETRLRRTQKREVCPNTLKDCECGKYDPCAAIPKTTEES